MLQICEFHSAIGEADRGSNMHRPPSVTPVLLSTRSFGIVCSGFIDGIIRSARIPAAANDINWRTSADALENNDAADR